MKTSRQILLLCALTLATGAALGSSRVASSDDSADNSADNSADHSPYADNVEAVALEDVVSTDEPALKPKKFISLGKVALSGAALRVMIYHGHILASFGIKLRKSPLELEQIYIEQQCKREQQWSPWWIMRVIHAYQETLSINFSREHWQSTCQIHVNLVAQGAGMASLGYFIIASFYPAP